MNEPPDRLILSAFVASVRAEPGLGVRERALDAASRLRQFGWKGSVRRNLTGTLSYAWTSDAGTEHSTTIDAPGLALRVRRLRDQLCCPHCGQLDPKRAERR